MSNWPLPGGAVEDPPSDQNFRALSEKGGEVEGTLTSKVSKIEKEGLPASGKAGGVLKGEYPNPEFATAQATKAELENETSLRESKDATEKAARESADTTLTSEVATEKSARETADGERVKGPASATESDIAVYSGTTGKIVKDGGKTIAETLARANHTGTQLAATVSDFDTQVRKSTLNQMTAPTEDLSVNSHKVTKVNEPTKGTDAANKTYVDIAASAAAAGLSFKAPVSYATTAAITATAEAEKTLEGNCPLEVDGKAAPAVGTRLLIKNQVSEKRNGIYEATKEECFGGEGKFGEGGEFGVGSKWLLTRTSDADAEGEVIQGMYVPVLLGTTNGGTAWTQSTANPIIIGTTAQSYTPFTATPGGTAGGDLTGTYPNPTIGTGKVTSAKIEDGAILNADVNSAAAIAYSKLALATSIVNADIATAAAIAYSKLSLAASIKDSDLVKPIVVGNVKANAEIVSGSGFTVEHPATGRFIIKLTSEAATSLVPVATLREPASTNAFIEILAITKQQFEVKTVIVLGALTDEPFTFMVKAS